MHKTHSTGNLCTKTSRQGACRAKNSTHFNESFGYQAEFIHPNRFALQLIHWSSPEPEVSHAAGECMLAFDKDHKIHRVIDVFFAIYPLVTASRSLYSLRYFGNL